MAYATLAFDLGAHRDALSRLWADNMSDPAVAAIVPERVRWLYERNPEGPPTTVLIDDGGPDGLVGCASVMPRRAWAGGREVRAGVLCDLAVARRHRVGGPALMLQRSLIEAIKGEGYAFLWGYPNRNSLPVFKRLGYKPVAEALSWVRPLRTGEFLRRFAPPPAADAGGALLDAALSLAERGAAAAFAAGREGAHEDHFDARFDELWARARGHYEVTGARDAAFLRWRYEEFPSGRHLVFGLSEGATLVGYVIYRVVSGGGVHVADLFCDDPERHFDALLLHFVRAMRAAGHASVVIALIAPEAVGARLRRHGFVRRNDPRPLVVRPLEGEGLETVVDPRRWYIIDGDLDILPSPRALGPERAAAAAAPGRGVGGSNPPALSFATSLLPFRGPTPTRAARGNPPPRETPSGLLRRQQPRRRRPREGGAQPHQPPRPRALRALAGLPAGPGQALQRPRAAARERARRRQGQAPAPARLRPHRDRRHRAVPARLEGRRDARAQRRAPGVRGARAAPGLVERAARLLRTQPDL